MPLWLKLGATAVAAVVVAEGAAWVLSPSEIVEPIAVDENDFLPAQQVADARDYRSGQRLLYVGGVVAQGAVLVLLVAGRPRQVRDLLERAAERPVLGGAAAAAGLVAALSVVTLPFDIAAHERAVDVGPLDAVRSAPGRGTGSSRTRSEPCSPVRSERAPWR